MKLLKLSIFLLALTCTTAITVSCGNKSAKTETEQKGKEYTSAYICPMHCEGSGSNEPGTCPVCGMDYEKNEDHQSDGHTHNGQ